MSLDTYGLSARIMSGSTVLAAADSGGTFQPIISATSAVDGSFANSGEITFDYVNAGTAALWNAAVLTLRQTYTQNGNKDQRGMEIDTFDLTGIYVAKPVVIPAASGPAPQYIFEVPAKKKLVFDNKKHRRVDALALALLR